MSRAIENFGAPLSAVELYYWRLMSFFDAVGKFNHVRGIYDKLDEWMPPEVATVFQKSYGGNRRIVEEKYFERKGRIERTWGAVLESCNELGMTYTEQDVREFRPLARSTNPETQFRTRMRGKVERLHKAAGKERENRAAGKKPKAIYPQTLRDLIAWYQTPKKK